MESFTLCAFADEADPMLTGQIEALHGNGIQWLEVRWVDGKNITQLTVSEAHELHRRLEDAGIRVWSVGSPLGKITLADDFEAHLELERHTLELGRILEARALRIFSFYPAEKENWEAARGPVMERMDRMLQTAEGSGLLICHENEKGIYGSNAERCLDLHKTFPSLRAVFDPANFIQCRQPTLPAWQLLKPYVAYMHVKDALSDGRVVPAGCGEGHLAELLRGYAAQGGRMLTLEPHLSVFDGLGTLERTGERSQVGGYCYNSPRAAFDAAAGALSKLIGVVSAEEEK